MGCVTMSQEFFPKGHITEKAMKKAEIAARQELEPIVELFKKSGWEKAIGASGTIKAINKVTTESGWCDHGITLEALKKLVNAINETTHIDLLKLKGLAPERAPVFPGGVAILYGLFKELKIQQMEVSDSALREGLLYELMGRIHQEDVRSRSALNLAKRYNADMEQASRVEHTARYCVEQVAETWKLDAYAAIQWLTWAAHLHEVGLNIAHNNHHKHGAYITENADLFGYTYQEQQLLATLIRLQRRKLPQNLNKILPKPKFAPAMQLIILFRLAVLLHRSRSNTPLPKFNLKAKKNKLKLEFPENWLEDHPLTLADLEQEASYLSSIEYEMSFQ